MIGSVLDKYEVLQKLGEGATATVYRGRHLTIGKDVAIKVLHPHLSASSRNRERFNREARAVGRLSHQNIVSILDYSGQQAEDCYIVTELVEGVTLLELLQDEGNLPSEVVALLALDLCSALAFAHAEGIIHRDVKPENIMVRRDGRVKLMDFGVARVLDEGSITIDGSLLGSPAYMSPQQALDQPLDGRSDLFSLGSVLFHAVTGHVPFAGTNASIILRNIIDAQRPELLELAPTASPSLAAVIDRLLQVRPEDRYHNAADVAEALLASLAEVGLAPDHPQFNVRAYMLNPGSFTTALGEHLRGQLLANGRARLARGDHLGALQLFNRLLALDEADGRENAEVIQLIQSLHQAPVEPSRGFRRWGIAVAALIFSASAGVWWFSRPSPPPPRAHVAPDVGASGPTAPPADPPPAPPPTEAATALVPPPGPTTPTVSAPPAEGSVKAVSGTRRPPEVPDAAPPPVAESPAELTIVSNFWAEVWVDGKRVGQRGNGPSAGWVATRDNPLTLSPGEHTLVLKNTSSEPWETTLTVAAGEKRHVEAELRRLKVEFQVNPSVPRDCTYHIGPVAYGKVSESPRAAVREPDPSWQVVFDCPAPLGRIAEPVGPTSGGDIRMIPVRVPTTP